jgi:outer membrane receptor for ferrienterochelin and colicins
MNKVKKLLLSTIFALSSAHARSGDIQDYRNISLEELSKVQISIATGNSTSLAKIPATASIIYASDIENMGATTLNDVLERIPGLHITLSSLSRLDSVYSTRGLQSGFNAEFLLMINGTLVKNAIQGGRPVLFRFPVHTIERIEIIRGPGSAVYGADAYSGILNIITKDGSAIEKPAMGASYGSFNSSQVWFEASTAWDEYIATFNFTHLQTDGDANRVISDDLQSAFDRIFGTHASLAGGSLATRYEIYDTRISITGKQTQINLWNWKSADAGLGAGGAQALDPNGHTDDDVYMADINYHFEEYIDGLDNSIKASHMFLHQYTKFNLLPNGANVPIGHDGNLNFSNPVGMVLFTEGLIGIPFGDSIDDEIEFTSTYSGFDSHRIRFSTGFGRLTFKSGEKKNFGPGVIDGTKSVINGDLTDVTNTQFVFLQTNTRHLSFISIQDEYQISNDLILTSGVRFDRYSDFGSTINPRLALVWNSSEKLTTKLLYGSAFRAPSFSELYYQNNPVTVGNRNVKPEKLKSVELAFSYLFTKNLKANVTLFNYSAIDMIEFVPDSNGASKTAQNAKSQDGHGIEAELSYKPSNQFSLNASISNQHSTDDLGNRIPDAPESQIKINMTWNIDKNYYLNTDLYRVMGRSRDVNDLRSPLADYTWINANFRIAEIFNGFDVNLAIKNLSNVKAYEPSSGQIVEDYPLEGRSFWVGFKYSM